MTKEQRNEFEDIVTASEVLIEYCLSPQGTKDIQQIVKFQNEMNQIVEETGFTKEKQEQFAKEKLQMS